jgi:hypothetical protein
MRVWLSYAFVLVVEVAKSRAGGVSVVARAVVSPANYRFRFTIKLAHNWRAVGAARGSVGSRDGDYPEMMAGKRQFSRDGGATWDAQRRAEVLRGAGELNRFDDHKDGGKPLLKVSPRSSSPPGQSSNSRSAHSGQ